MLLFEEAPSSCIQQRLLHPKLFLHGCQPAGIRATNNLLNPSIFSLTFELCRCRRFVLCYFALCWVSFSFSCARSFLRCSSAFCSSSCVHNKVLQLSSFLLQVRILFMARSQWNLCLKGINNKNTDLLCMICVLFSLSSHKVCMQGWELLPADTQTHTSHIIPR